MKTKDMTVIERTMKNLTANNYSAYYCENSKEAVELAKTLIKPGDTLTHGGSQTLKEAKFTELFNCGDYNYLDRGKKGLSQDEIEDIYRKTYCADAYFTSSNAVTENGELYNVDGNSNRVSAILYGPKSVIVVVGYNKIVKDLDEAVYRVKTQAAPPNAKRLNCDTYCEKAGECLSLSKDGSFMCDGCKSVGRICCNYVVSARQRRKDRIKVIIVGESLGY